MNSHSKYTLIGYIALVNRKYMGFCDPVFIKDGIFYFQELTEGEGNSVFVPISEDLENNIVQAQVLIDEDIQFNENGVAIYLYVIEDQIIYGERNDISGSLFKLIIKYWDEFNTINKYDLFSFFGYTKLQVAERGKYFLETNSNIVTVAKKITDYRDVSLPLIRFYIHSLLKYSFHFHNFFNFPDEKFITFNESKVIIGEYELTKSIFHRLLKDEDVVICDLEENNYAFDFLFYYLNLTEGNIDSDFYNILIEKNILQKCIHIPHCPQLFENLLSNNNETKFEAEILHAISGYRGENETGCPAYLNAEFENQEFGIQRKNRDLHVDDAKLDQIKQIVASKYNETTYP